jgi:hypothetical protein
MASFFALHLKRPIEASSCCELRWKVDQKVLDSE